MSVRETSLEKLPGPWSAIWSFISVNREVTESLNRGVIRTSKWALPVSTLWYPESVSHSGF